MRAGRREGSTCWSKLIFVQVTKQLYIPSQLFSVEEGSCKGEREGGGGGGSVGERGGEGRG